MIERPEEQEARIEQNLVEQYESKQELRDSFDRLEQKDAAIDTSGMDNPLNATMSSDETREFVDTNFPEEHTRGMKFEYDGEHIERTNPDGDKVVTAADTHYREGGDRVAVHAQNFDGTAEDTPEARAQMERTIQHEVGHNVYDNYLTPEAQREWNSRAADDLEWGPDKKTAAREVVNQQGDINAASATATREGAGPTEIHDVHHDIQENFADSYRDFCNGELPEDDWRHNFMKNHVF